jgi:hypothetical protein
MKIRAETATCDTVDLAVEVRGGMEISRNGIGRQTRVVGIADRIVAPKRSRGVEVLVHAAKQVDIGAIGCCTKPTTRCWKRGDGGPSIRCGGVLVSVCDSDVIGDPAEAVDVAAY